MEEIAKQETPTVLEHDQEKLHLNSQAGEDERESAVGAGSESGPLAPGTGLVSNSSATLEHQGPAGGIGKAVTLPKDDPVPTAEQMAFPDPGLDEAPPAASRPVSGAALLPEHQQVAPADTVIRATSTSAASESVLKAAVHGEEQPSASDSGGRTSDHGPSHLTAAPAVLIEAEPHPKSATEEPPTSQPLLGSQQQSSKRRSSSATAAAASPDVSHEHPKGHAQITKVQPGGEPSEGLGAATVHRTARHETAKERLTRPTAMRMLEELEKTQGGKSEWHIASGVTFKSKRLSPDEMESMVSRLCTIKPSSSELGRPHAVRLVYKGTKESLVPVKVVTQDENIAYMAELYERCQATRQKTKEELARKYLQPLTRPAAAARGGGGKGAKAASSKVAAAGGGQAAGAEAAGAKA